MKEPSFEEKMKELEAIVTSLESGSVPLEEMTELYEKGVELYSECDMALTAFEKRLKEQDNA